MNIRKSLLSLLAFSAIATQSYAYVVYNNTDSSLRVDDQNFGGMDVSIGAHSSAACDPAARGCHGNMSFVVYSQNGFVQCRWQGKLDEGRGYYYVINSTNRPWPLDTCVMELFRN